MNVLTCCYALYHIFSYVISVQLSPYAHGEIYLITKVVHFLYFPTCSDEVTTIKS